MLRYMLDTNILIYTVKNKPQSVRQQFEAHEGEICTSSVSAMEMLYGAHKSQSLRRNLDVIEALLSRLTVLDFDIVAAQHAGAIRASLASDGKTIGPYDTMIAGHARSLGLVLVTNNVGEFRRVSGLMLENWAE